MTALRLSTSRGLAALLWSILLTSPLLGCPEEVVEADADGDGDGDADGDADGDGDGDCELEDDPVERPELPDRPRDVDYLIISADMLAEAAEEHAEWRDGRGHRAEVLLMSELLDDGHGGFIGDLDEAIERMRGAIRARRDDLDDDRTLFVLLLGDARRGWRGSVQEIPPAELTGWQWEEAVSVTSDNLIADLDGDDLPDVALGRVPASRNNDAERILARTRALEEAYNPGPWNYQVSVFASEGGFSEMIDEMIEEAAFAAVRDVPLEWQMSLTYARPGSPYAYPPALFSDRIYDLLNAGSMMTVYIGHGWEEGFDTVNWEGEVAPILDTDDLDQLEMDNRASLLVLIACLIGSFDTDESLAEQFLNQREGATALLASTEISHPYANGVLIRELAVTALIQRLPTMGEVVLEAKRRMMTISAADDPVRAELDSYAVIDPSSATPELREDLIRAHEHMYTLFGDPAQRIAYPAGSATIELEAEEVTVGEPIRACVQIHGPPSGFAEVTLETDRERVSRDLLDWEMDDPDRDEVVLSNYELANDKSLNSWSGQYEGGGFFVSFETTSAHVGTLTLRVYADDDDELDAIGTATVEVLRTPEGD